VHVLRCTWCSQKRRGS